MQAGDAIIFVDALCHGSATRVNMGERRHSVYRYGSSWNRTRFGYHASPDLLERLGPLARKARASARVHPSAGCTYTLVTPVGKVRRSERAAMDACGRPRRSMDGSPGRIRISRKFLSAYTMRGPN
jgi:hypothetical protein